METSTVIRIKSKLTDIHIAAISRIVANSSDPVSRLIRFFDLVGIKYVLGEEKCRLLKCIDEGGVLQDVMEIAGNSFSAIINDPYDRKITRIRKAL